MVRTAVYVDGFNLFYGALKDAPTGHRWLDLKAMAVAVLRPEHVVNAIHYCTARIRPAGPTDTSHLRQELYIKALKAHLPDLQVHYGHFLRHEATAPNAAPPPPRVRYLKTEEKGSDVNLATRMVADAFLDRYDCAVIVSNDGDMAPAARIVREEVGKTVGVIPPCHHPNSRNQRPRRVSSELRRESTFVRDLRVRTIARCQMPSPIPGTRYHKPAHW